MGGIVEVQLATAAAMTETEAGVITETAAGAMTVGGDAMTASQPITCRPLLSWTKFHSRVRSDPRHLVAVIWQELQKWCIPL